MPDGILGHGILNEKYAFSNLIDALKVAAESARQLAYLKEQREWFLVQNGLDTIRERCIELAVRKLV